jgi:TatD DNase family protein
MFNLVDIGINLMHDRYKNDRDEVIQRAINSGVTKMIITGTTLWNSKSALEKAKKHNEILYSTAGIHPHNAKDCNENTINELKKLASHKEVVAIGECGLDFDRDFSPRDIQEYWFEEQIKLACELNLPLFLHERESSEKFIEILSKHRNNFKNAVVHCFTGKASELKKYLEMDLHIGFTGAICDSRWTHLKELVKKIPIDKLMIETDGPFLLPKDMKNKPKDRRNESSFLPHILDTIASCIGKSSKEIAEITTNNAINFFNLNN